RLNIRPVGARAVAQLRSGARDACLAGVAREIAAIVRKQRAPASARVRKAKARKPSASAVPDFSGEWEGMWLSMQADRAHHAKLVIREKHGGAFSALMRVTYERSRQQTIVDETLAGAIGDERTLSLIGIEATYVQKGASALYSLDKFNLKIS